MSKAEISSSKYKLRGERDSNIRNPEYFSKANGSYVPMMKTKVTVDFPRFRPVACDAAMPHFCFGDELRMRAFNVVMFSLYNE